MLNKFHDQECPNDMFGLQCLKILIQGQFSKNPNTTFTEFSHPPDLVNFASIQEILQIM